MPKVSAFYSTSERIKPYTSRVYHNNSACEAGQEIPQNERRPGTGSYRLCEDCAKLNAHGR